MLDEGVVAAQDIDLCMLLGAGWPFHLGGITPYLDRTGTAEKVTGGPFHLERAATPTCGAHRQARLSGSTATRTAAIATRGADEPLPVRSHEVPYKGGAAPDLHVDRALAHGDALALRASALHLESGGSHRRRGARLTPLECANVGLAM